MLRFLIFFLLTTSLFGAYVEHFKWQEGETYSAFLERNSLPSKALLHDLDDDNTKLIQEVRQGFNCHILKSNTNEIQQIIIPMNDELQIHIYKTKNSYAFEAIPIISETKIETIALKIQRNPSSDIHRVVKNSNYAKKLNNIFKSAFGKSIDTTIIQKNDNLVMIYEQKYRLGKPFSMPKLHVAMIEINRKPHYIYLNKDDLYYDEEGKQVEEFLLSVPLKYSRISSRFTKRRYHPILKRWKAHTGIDYAARRGTPIHAAGSGRVVYAGWAGGYGNVIKIQHSDGFLTLYAHQKGFRHGIKRGVRVKQNQLIGYVGSTGRSTGPHLHFGLYKNGRPINPEHVVQVTTKKLKKKEKEAFIKLRQNYNEKVAQVIKEANEFHRVPTFVNTFYYVSNR